MKPSRTLPLRLLLPPPLVRHPPEKVGPPREAETMRKELSHAPVGSHWATVPQKTKKTRWRTGSQNLQGGRGKGDAGWCGGVRSSAIQPPAPLPWRWIRWRTRYSAKSSQRQDKEKDERPLPMGEDCTESSPGETMKKKKTTTKHERSTRESSPSMLLLLLPSPRLLVRGGGGLLDAAAVRCASFFRVGREKACHHMDSGYSHYSAADRST